jgi:hypothetical protein
MGLFIKFNEKSYVDEWIEKDAWRVYSHDVEDDLEE